MLTPIELYKRDLQRPDFSIDTAQQGAVQRTQSLYNELLETIKNHHGRLTALRSKFLPRKKESIRGLYLWGGVGRGKTYLVDNFYQSLPFEQKTRVHFHRFMQKIHSELKVLRSKQNPLIIIAARLAQQVRVICLDEFYVSDITDAMLLSGLLKALFEQQVTLVTTSNIHPDNLYQGGLQRERFLPAIALIKNHMEVVNIDSGIDYRLRNLEQAETYYYPLTPATQRKLEEQFTQLTTIWETDKVLEINGRLISTVRCADGIVWFDFQALCNIPRAVADYIELARCYNTVFINNIPSMGEASNDNALRLINLVDEFYDRNVKLIIAAQVPIEQLYTGQRQICQFQRTASRLQEMRACAYLSRPHLP